MIGERKEVDGTMLELVESGETCHGCWFYDGPGHGSGYSCISGCHDPRGVWKEVIKADKCVVLVDGEVRYLGLLEIVEDFILELIKGGESPESIQVFELGKEHKVSVGVTLKECE